LEEKHMHGKTGLTRREVLALAALAPLAGAPGSARAAAGPDGQLIWGVHISLAPIWFDPADISGIITPFMVPCPFQAQGAMARLSDILRQRHRGRLDRAKDIRRKGW